MQDLKEIVLSKTQRKTPTVVHKHFAISRIRAFYTRKIKFAQQTLHDRLTLIINEFPKLQVPSRPSRPLPVPVAVCDWKCTWDPGRAPVLLGPDGDPLRQGPLQGGAGADQHGPESHRQRRPRLRPPHEVRRRALPLQDAQAGRPRTHGQDHRAPEGELRLPRAGPPAPRPPPLHRPQHPHPHHHRLPQRRQVQPHQHTHPRRRRGPALRLHHQVTLRRTHRLQVPPLAGLLTPPPPLLLHSYSPG